MNKEILNKLDFVISNRHLCCIKREYIDDYHMHGFPSKHNNSFVLLEYEYDFEFDGYKIIRLQDITEARYQESERFGEHIFAQEGIMTSNSCIIEKIDSFEDIFAQFMKKGENIIIECEKEENFFLIGRAVDISIGYIDFLSFNGVGVWDKTTTKIEFEHITCITFGSRYINIISKYIEPYPKA